MDPDNLNTLNAIGYWLTQQNAFEEALPYFEIPIQIDPTHACAYNNRGQVKLEPALLEEGLSDILHSIPLDDKNAYAYRNQGIYHLKNHQYDQAMYLFKKAI